MLKGKTIVLGVSGGIAIYKAVEVASRLMKLNAQVKVIMTEAACEFVNPLTFRSIVHYPVAVGLFTETSLWDIKHIALAAADLILVAPATYNIVGKVASGIADDLLTSTIAATTAPVVFVPAMNENMYANKIFVDNKDRLTKQGYIFVEPAIGKMACGTEGKGRFPEADLIIEAAIRTLSIKDMCGTNLLVTAGPTVEPIDPVRFLTNRSSGKMGYALALAALRRGAAVTLVSGPTNLEVPSGLKEFVPIETTREMLEAVTARRLEQDIIIKAAAPMDFCPQGVSLQKIKKTNKEDLTLTFGRNPDILATLGKDKGNLLLVGFAAETENLLANAKEKLIKKNCDILVANLVGGNETGFKSDFNEAFIVTRENTSELPKMTKLDMANRILDEALKIKKIT